ncbi:DUF2889 domain-containing protein [Azoarcus sp. KH32C]|uniref:DUF2889 domain-containing protein n=1 Tax=Azoarcus sp. KH32C TaxID=748247 RepID=UPI0002385E27|nr:DUF2889 domain-containing protein [Azoarcus sp. KH32C]BAL27217.1 hypothetical protein AZKH_p0334 [Azoarcus sp. KH32C]
MSLPDAQARTRLHTRKFVYQCYLRDDGLWDIDGELSDVKDYPYMLHSGEVPPHQPVHNMHIRLTVDDSLTIKEIVARTAHAPFPDCMQTADPMQAMVGVTIGPGWRKEIEQRIGGVKGCTHLRDLLSNAATAAYQSVSAHALHARLNDRNLTTTQGERPHFLDKCMVWALDGPVVKEYEPHFYVSPSSEQRK